MKNILQKLKGGLPWLILLAVILFIVIYIRSNKIESSFWDNAVSNLIATLLGLLGGIPVALSIDRYLRKQEKVNDYNNDRKREKEILGLIREELEFSLNSVFLNGRKGNLKDLFIQPLKSDVWDAINNSGETKVIKEPELLNRITSAYYVLKFVKKIEEHAYIALRTTSLVFTDENGKQVSSAQKAIKDARQFDNLFEESLTIALKMISERVQKLNEGNS